MAVTFDLDFDGSPGRVDHVAPGLRRLLAPNPSRFTFHGTGTYIVGAGNEVAVIDPGPEREAHHEALLTALDGLRVSHIFVTHTHRDHSPLARRLSAVTGAPIVGCGPHGETRADDPDDVIDFGPLDDDDADAASTPGPAESEEEARDGGVDTEHLPDTQLHDGDVVTGDGWTLEAVHTPGHTSNHLCFAWREASALFTGDHVMGWSTSVIGPPDGDMGAYLESLEKLLERDDEVYWPTHGNPIREPHTYVRGLIEHRRERERQVVESLQTGVDQIEQLVRARYQHVSKRLWPAAARSIHAHLLDLAERGVVASSSGSHRLTDRYELV